MKNITVLTILLACGLFLFRAPLADAQTNAGITIVPAVIEEAADPGSVIVQNLKVTNVSDTDREFFIFKRDIIGVEAGGVPIFADEVDEKTEFEISEWIHLPSETISVKAGETIDLPFSVDIPVTASPGSHFGGIFVSQEAPKLRKTGAGVGYEVTSIVSIRISGNIIDSARIRSFSTDKLLYSSKHVIFNAKIENQGNILIRPRGPVSITSMFSTEPVTFIVNESLAGIFPGTTRDISFSWDSDELGFGRYEAVLALAYDGDGGQKTIDATLVFWVFPTKIILAIIGAFVVIFGGGYLLTRYYINQAILRAAGGRRIVPQRYRKQVGVSRFAFVFISLMTVVLLFLIMILIFFA